MSSILSEFHNTVYYEQFLDYLKKKYPEEYDTFTVTDIQDKFESVFMMGLHQAKKFQKIGMTCNLLHNDRVMDKRMLSKLGHILFELTKISSYPTVAPMQLGNAVKKVIGKDKRYSDKYRDLIISYSIHKREFNKVDMSNFTSQFPDEYIVERSVW